MRSLTRAFAVRKGSFFQVGYQLYSPIYYRYKNGSQNCGSLKSLSIRAYPTIWTSSRPSDVLRKFWLNGRKCGSWSDFLMIYTDCSRICLIISDNQPTHLPHPVSTGHFIAFSSGAENKSWTYNMYQHYYSFAFQRVVRWFRDNSVFAPVKYLISLISWFREKSGMLEYVEHCSTQS